jgi:ribosomal protein S18 acetylase RimI-like enzyme
MGIERLNLRCIADVNAVADLHVRYLPDSPVVRMGERFLRKFYYTKLIEDGLMGCEICRTDGQVVGFISYTKYPLDFMTRGIRKRFFYLSWLIFTSIVVRPAMIKDILFVLRIMRERSSESHKPSEGNIGEVLSLVAHSEYRRYIPPGGKSRLSSRLFETMVKYFRGEGFDRVHLMVQPSNLASNIFFQTMGCEFEKTTHAGVVTHLYTYYLNGEISELKTGGSV